VVVDRNNNNNAIIDYGCLRRGSKGVAIIITMSVSFLILISLQFYINSIHTKKKHVLLMRESYNSTPQSCSQVIHIALILSILTELGIERISALSNGTFTKF
jgi:hypothetical protein